MTCQDYKDIMMAYLDNELSDEQKQAFEEHLETCRHCSGELAEFKKLKSITEDVALAEPEDRVWQQYWDGIYNRVERGVGWIVFSVAAISLTIYGGYRIIETIVDDPTVELSLKTGLLALITGLAILFVSVLRERVYFWRKDRYRDVRR